MILTKEEFENRLAAEDFKRMNPRRIEPSVVENFSVENLLSMGISKKCAEDLYTLDRKIAILLEKGMPIGKNFLIIANENLRHIKNAVASILIHHGICDNYFFEDTVKAKSEMKLGGIIDYKVGNLSREVSECVDKAKFNFDAYIFFCCSRVTAALYLNSDKYLFPFVIEDDYSLIEKQEMIRGLCSGFGFDLIEDKRINAEGFLSLKQLTYKKLVEKMMDTDKTLKISELLPKSDDVEEEVGKTISETELEGMIGLDVVKKQISRLIKFLEKKKNGISSKHMVFMGNPGTGKTTVARCLAKRLYRAGVVKKDIFIETDKSGLCAGYVGQTAMKTKELFKKAQGGVLFVDEAYSLAVVADEDHKDYGYEALATLMKEMEDNRDNTVVIFAGYTKETEQMLSMNPGLSSRIQFHVTFPDYSTEELYQIFLLFITAQGYTVTEGAKEKILFMFETDRKEENFANGRYVRNLAEKLMLIQSERSTDFDLSEEDVLLYLSEAPKKEQKHAIGFCI